MIDKSNMNKLAAVLVSCFAVVGCSSSNSGSSDSSTSSNSNNGDVSSLQIVAPKTIFSKPAESSPGYIVIKNPTDAAVNNLNYSLANLVGGAKGTIIDPDSAASCATMPAHGQCNVKVMIPAGAVAGSFGFSANNDSSLLSKLGKVFKDSVTKTSNLTIGIQQAAYNNLSGADGITLSYYHTVINGVPYILVTGLVASANAGSFNNIVLVDNNGNPIPNQELISGGISNAQGTTFQVLLPVPASGGITQTIKVQTQQVSNGQTKVVSTSTSSSTLTTTEGVGIVDLLPDAVYLTKDNPEQMITFSNTGDAEAQLQSLLASNPNLEVIFSQGSLGSGETTIATIKMKDPSKPATNGGLFFTYNNGQNEVKDSAVVEENVIPAPTPDPSPTPTPAPKLYPGLTAELNPSHDFFTDTAVGSASNQMTITNTGNTRENNIVLTLPPHFSIGAGSDPDKTCTIGTNPGEISDDLAAYTGSCDITVNYDNDLATTDTTGEISIAYNYNGSTPVVTPTEVAVNYRVTQLSANLSFSAPTPVPTIDQPYIFPNTLFDGAGTSNTMIFTITNSGDGAATNMSSVVNSTTAGLFTATATGVSTPCGAILAAGASCDIGVQFGSIPDNTSAGNKTGDLTVSYKVTTVSTSNTDLVAGLSGQVAGNFSAAFSTPTTRDVGTSFQGSWPSLGIQKDTVSGPNSKITYTITNSGTDAATDFKVMLPSALTGWNTPTTTCPTSTGTNLPVNGSCTVSITPVTTTARTTGVTNLGIQLAWKDQDSPDGETQPMYLALPAVQVYNPAAIAVTTNPASNISVAPGGSFTMTATLSGGYSVPDQIIQATTSTSGVTFTNNNCTVKTGTPSCTITAKVSGNAAAATNQTVQVTNTTTPVAAANPNPSSITYNIVHPTKIIFLTTGTHDGNFGGFSGADSFCNSDSAKPPGGGTYKALLFGNNSTTPGIEYVTNTTPAKTIAVATTTNLTGSTTVGVSTADGLVNNIVAGAETRWYTGSGGDSDCENWTWGVDQGTDMRFGHVGYGSTVTAPYWWYAEGYDGIAGFGTVNCRSAIYLLCVQQ